MVRERWMYLFILPGFGYFVVFRYLPLLGNVAAFQDYSPFLGFAGSPWVGLRNFVALGTDPAALGAIRNTLLFSLLQVVFVFPAPILLALLLNSVLSRRIRAFVQSVVYLPHFLSWVIVVSVWQQVLGGAGLVNHLFGAQGSGGIDIMANPNLFPLLVTAQVAWKDIGWGTVIFLAALGLIDQRLHESAALDGAGPLRRFWHVTLPGLRPVLVLLLVLRLGTVLNTGFEQILLQQHAVGDDAAQVLDTFVYYRGVVGGDWGVATAAGLVKGVVGTVLVVAANKVAVRFGYEGVF
jgi:putative aldouronate transport system permease protein